MKRIRIIGLCLVAAFALSAIAAGTASALPEVGRCVSKPETGKYKNSNCTEKAGALKSEKSFEFVKNAVKEHFVSESVPASEIHLEGASGVQITCESQTAEGEYLKKGTTPSTKEVHHVVATFHGCALPLFTATCQNKGAAAGEITTTKLKGLLEYTSGKGTKTPKVAIALSPEVKKKGFALFECFKGAEKVAEVYVGEGPGKGHETILAGVTELNVMSTTATQSFKGTKGVQELQKKEGSTVIDNLESSLNGPKGTFEKSDQVLQELQTSEEALEIKA